MNTKQFDLLHYTNTIVKTLNLILNERHWTLKKLSDESGISYDTLKKLMSGQTGCPTTYNLIKISQALGVSIDYLLGMDSHLDFDFSKLPKRAHALLSEVAHIEQHLFDLNKQHGKTYIPIMVPSGAMGDGMLYDSFYSDLVDVSSYDNEFGDAMMCGLLITSKAFHPTYLKGDILLIANDRPPLYGETGIFLYKRHLYIRIYAPGNPSLLMPVNNFGKTLRAETPSEWTILGRVLTVLRN